VPVMGTDDTYEDDIHFIDGILHFDSYEIGQDVENAVPGAPDYVVDERFFRERFDTTPWLLVFKRQQRDGPFWDRSSLAGRYDAIRVPSFVIGGWYDGYRDSVPRMLEHLRAPVKALLGPWGHSWPHDAYPKPQMEWRHEAVRWFDHWLKGRATGIGEEPRFAVYARRWHAPGFELGVAPGEWRFEDGWPLARGRELVLNAHAEGALRETPAAAAARELAYAPSAGVEAGGSVMWWGDFALDQRPTDAQSLVFDSAPLDAELEILGFPRAHLRASASAPLAHWFVRLSDVAPDGQVTLITGAGLNGAHRRSARSPQPLVPGVVYPLDVELHFTSWTFGRGHRIRLSVANAQWPMFWPTPYPMTTSLALGGADATRLVLPVVPASTGPRPQFLPPAADPQLPGYRTLDSGTVSGYSELAGVERDAASGRARVTSTNRTVAEYPWGTSEHAERMTHEVSDRDPADASVRGEYTITIRLPERVLEVQGALDFRSDRDSFHFLYTRRLTHNGSVVRERQWRDSFPRDYQ